MPARPVWYQRLPYILQQLRSHPRTYVDRATVESLLGIGRRRAQQIMAPCLDDRVGASGLADRDALIDYLQTIAAGDECAYEIRRRQKVAHMIEELRKERVESPRLLVEAPVRVVNQQLESLPPGVQVERGRITVEFQNAQEGLEKLLALAMAISNNFEGFEEVAGVD